MQESIEVGYAIYDPDNWSSTTNSYWNHVAETLDPGNLHDLFYRFLCTNTPNNPNELTPQMLCGGVVFTNDNIFVYRFTNGGRDKIGRSGRYLVLVAGALNTEVARRIDFRGLLRSGLMKQFAESAADQPPTYTKIPNRSKEPVELAEDATIQANFQEGQEAHWRLPEDTWLALAVSKKRTYRAFNSGIIVLVLAVMITVASLLSYSILTTNRPQGSPPTAWLPFGWDRDFIEAGNIDTRSFP